MERSGSKGLWVCTGESECLPINGWNVLKLFAFESDGEVEKARPTCDLTRTSVTSASRSLWTLTVSSTLTCALTMSSRLSRIPRNQNADVTYAVLAGLKIFLRLCLFVPKNRILLLTWFQKSVCCSVRKGILGRWGIRGRHSLLFADTLY